MSDYERSHPPVQDDISLVDLFAVVLRYRRLVVGLPLLAGIVAVVVVYAAPVFLPPERFEARVYRVEQEVVFEPILPQAEQYLRRSPAATFARLATDTRTVAAVYTELNRDPLLESLSEAEFLAYIRREIIGSRFDTSFSSCTGVLTMAFESDDPEHAQQVLSAIYREATARFADAMDLLIVEAVRNAEVDILTAESAIRLVSSMDGDLGRNSSALTMQAVANQLALSFDNAVSLYSDATLALSELERLRSELDSAYSIHHDALVLRVDDPAGSGRAVTVVVAVFAAGFFALFLAFVLNYIRLVKADPVESGKLRQALEQA